jgi:putative NIF3 family GTP cyclohydrolase 1 type 2
MIFWPRIKKKLEQCKNDLIEDYVKNEMSLIDCHLKYDVSKVTIKKFLQINGIKLRTQTQSVITSAIRENSIILI